MLDLNISTMDGQVLCMPWLNCGDEFYLVTIFLMKKNVNSNFCHVCMYVCMRFGTAKTQLRAAGGYFSLPPWLNNPFSKWWLGICAVRNVQNSDCYFSLYNLYVFMYVCVYVCVCVCVCVRVCVCVSIRISSLQYFDMIKDQKYGLFKTYFYSYNT